MLPSVEAENSLGHSSLSSVFAFKVQATEVTTPECPLKMRSHVPPAFHIRIVMSALDENSRIFVF